MSYQQKDMTGSLFRNTRKGKDTHPDATGSCLIDGVAYWVNAWTKQDKNGNRYQSLSYKRKDQPQTQPVSKPRVARPASADMDDQIPF